MRLLINNKFLNLNTKKGKTNSSPYKNHGRENAATLLKNDYFGENPTYRGENFEGGPKWVVCYFYALWGH